MLDGAMMLSNSVATRVHNIEVYSKIDRLEDRKIDM